MDFAPVFLHTSRRRLVLPASEGRNDSVVLELDKLRKPQVQEHEEKLKVIDNLHECVVPVEMDKSLAYCGECDTYWPCATHRVLYPECNNVRRGDPCVHRI